MLVLPLAARVFGLADMAVVPSVAATTLMTSSNAHQIHEPDL